MSDIELVVKIPDVIYEGVKMDRVLDTSIEIVLDAIKNGTPLPKGHGKLVDVNEVEEYLNDIQLELDGWGETDSAIEIAKAKLGLDYSIDPIIEAETEVEDGNDD